MINKAIEIETDWVFPFSKCKRKKKEGKDKNPEENKGEDAKNKKPEEDKGKETQPKLKEYDLSKAIKKAASEITEEKKKKKRVHMQAIDMDWLFENQNADEFI